MQMKNGEIVGRLIALEVFSMTALGLYLANSRNDADYSKATALLDFLRQTVSNSASSLPLDVQAEAAKYAEYMVSTLAINLKTMRGETGHSH
jgi:hypothetical protein